MKTKVHTYKFYTFEEDEDSAYKALRAEIRQQSRQGPPSVFNADQKALAFYDKVSAHKEVEIDTKYLFADQWSTAEGLRLMSWSELRYKDPTVKQGYWVEVTEEMYAAQANARICGYCGKQEHPEGEVFCSHCLSSEYLTEDSLHQLRLANVFQRHRPDLSVPEREKLEAIWAEAQTRSNFTQEQDQKRIEQAHEKMLKDFHIARMEAEGFTKLAENKVKWSNLIFYKGKFLFAPANGMSQKQAEIWEKKLKEIGFDYPYEIRRKE